MKGSVTPVLTDPIIGSELIFAVKGKTNYMIPIDDLVAAASFTPGVEPEFLSWDKTWRQVDYSMLSGIPSLVENFGDLGDVPDYTSDDALKFIRVNSSYSGLEYATVNLDLSNYVTIDSAQTITGSKTFQNSAGIKISKGAGLSSFWIYPNTTGSATGYITTAGAITSNQSWYFPHDKSGTIALLSDIPSAPDLSNYVTIDVDDEQITGRKYFSASTRFVSINIGFGTYRTYIQSGNLTANTIFQFPINNGINGQVLTTNGGGVTSWNNASGSKWTDITLNSQNYIKRNGRVIIGNEVTGAFTNSVLTIKALTQNTTDATSIWLEKDYNYFLAKIDTQGGLHAGRSIEIGGPESISRRGNLNPFIRFKYPSDTGKSISFYMLSEPASNVTFYLPTSDGTNGQALVTNGAGSLTWSTVGSGSTYTVFTNTANGLVPYPNISDGTTKVLTHNGTTHSWTTLSTGVTTRVRLNTSSYRTGDITLQTVNENAISITEPYNGVFQFVHADTSTVATTSTSGFNIISSLNFDDYGHVVSISTRSLLPITSNGYFLRDDGTWVEVTGGGGGSGTVTSVAAGNGMSFTTFTTSGSVTLGTPSSITSTSTNSVGAGTHTHAITGFDNYQNWGLADNGTAAVNIESGAVVRFYGAGGTVVTRESNNIIITSSTTGTPTFSALSDTPSSYSGQGLKAVRVNSEENALEFYTVGSGGTVTSVGMTVPTGFTRTPSTITTSGTFTIGYGTGYSLPLTADTAKGVTAYGWGNHSGLYDLSGAASTAISTHESTYNHSNYNTAYSWGNHALAGYITGEIDPTGVSSVSVTGTTTKTIRITLNNTTYKEASWTDLVGEPGSGAHSLHSSTVHNNVQVNNLQAGQILKWDGTYWVNAADNIFNPELLEGDGYINDASFSGGLLSLTGTGSAGASVSLDGRYLKISDYVDTYVSGITVTGTTTKIITLTRSDSSTLTASFTDLNNYVNGISGTGNGTITLTRSGLSDLTLDLTHTHSGIPTGGYVTSFNSRQGVVLLTTGDIESVLTGLITSHTHNYTNNAGTVTSVTAGLGLIQSGNSTINPTINIQSHGGTAGSIGVLIIDDDTIGVSLGDGSTQAAAGNHTHTDLHTKKHNIISSLDHESNNDWQILYESDSKSLQELPLGDVDTILTSTSVATAPIFKSFYEFNSFTWGIKGLVPAPTNLTGDVLETRFLRADGTWISPSGTGGGMSNPMNAQNDIIIGSIGGAPAKLSKGENSTVLTINESGNIQWLAPNAVSHGDHTGEVTSSGMATTLNHTAISNKGVVTNLNTSDEFITNVSGVLKKITATNIKKYVLNYNTTTTPKVLISSSSAASWFTYSFIGMPNAPSAAGSDNQLMKWSSGNLVNYTPGILSNGSGITTLSYNGLSSVSISVDFTQVAAYTHTHNYSALPSVTASSLLGRGSASNGDTQVLTLGSNTASSTNAISISGTVITAKLENEWLPKLSQNLNVSSKTLYDTGHIIPKTTNSYNLGSATYYYKNLYAVSIKLQSWSFEVDGVDFVLKYGDTIKARFTSDGKIKASDDIIAFAV